jgi:hypothetical protein
MGFVIPVSLKQSSSSIAPFGGAWLLVLALGLAPLAGCALRAPRSGPEAAAEGGLRLLGAMAYPAGALALGEGPPFGSFSGLAFDRRSGQWVGAIDDAVPPRIAWMDIAFGATLGVTPLRFTVLHAGPDASANTMAGLELESLVAMPDGSFAATTEGYHDAKDLVHQAEVVFIEPDGTVTGAVQPRSHFAISAGDRTRGVRHNLGLESLTRTPDGRLVTGLEQPLVQDGPASNRSSGGLVRMLEFVERPGRGWAPGREWAYRLEPTAVVPGFPTPCEDGENGLSDMLALGTDRYLTLERACLLGDPGAPAYNPVKLFEVSTRAAEDVSGLPLLAGQAPRLVTKRLVLDVDSVLPQLPALWATGSNFEALALGPPGPRGERTVVLMSDDNLRDTQTTALLWLALP